MNKYSLMAFVRMIAVSFLFCGFPGVGTAQSVERISPDGMGRWLVDGFEIHLDIRCSISRSGFWPTKYCDEPSVIIARNLDKEMNTLSGTLQYFKLVAENIELGDKWMFDGNKDPNRRVALTDMTFGSVRSVELFKLLMSKENLKITFLTSAGKGEINSRVVVLTDFKSYADKEIRAIDYNYDQEESDARRKLMIGLAVLVVVLVMVFWTARFLFRKTRTKIAAVTEQIEARRVSRVAEDEAIRMVVRDSVQKADEQSLDTLRNQIRVALDAGDTKTAQELLRIMSQLQAK